MKTGAENRTKTIVLGAVAMTALLVVGYQLYGLLGGGSSSPTPPPPPAQKTTASSAPPVDSLAPSAASSSSGNQPSGPAMAGVNATKLSSSAGGLDPTLDEAAMLRTENLNYSGAGRNIFSSTYTAPVALPTNVPPPRLKNSAPPPPPAPAPPPPVCPPACPPIPLKFFGTQKFPSGKVQGFFLSGDDVYLAAEGEIIARKYKIVTITASSARVEDLTNTYEQSLTIQP